MATIQDTFNGYPVSYDEDTAQWYSTSQSINNAYDGSDSSNYFQINLTRGSGAETYLALNFDTSSIPSNATIKSVTCTAKCYCSNTQSNRVATRNIQLYSGSTAKGSAYTLSASTTAFSLDCGTWTRAELNNAKIVLHCVRGSNSTTSSYYLRFYGATLSIEYEYSDGATGDTIYIKQNGSWVEATDVMVKVSGTWRSISSAYKKVSGSWVEQDDKSAMFDSNAVYKKG